MPAAVSSWHPGELMAQEAMGVQDDVWGVHNIIEDGFSSQLAHFFPTLRFLPLTTLDEHRRPWVSLLTGKHGERGFARTGVIASGKSAMRISAPLYDGLPAKDSLLSKTEEPADMRRLVASVGVELENRRRNKFEGHILNVNVDSESDEVILDLQVDLALGNCPKYINVRSLQPSVNSPRRLSPASHTSLAAGIPLPPSALSLVASADLIFLGTRHSGARPADPTAYVSPYAASDVPRLGCNLRGGRPGFVRTFWDAERVDAFPVGSSNADQKGRTCLVVPDYSGNRFFQSIGNIFLDPVAAVTIPRFSVHHGQGDSTGSDVLHLTCEAEVVVGAEAAKLIRGVKALLKLWVVGYTQVQDALPLTQDGRAFGAASESMESAALTDESAPGEGEARDSVAEELRVRSTVWSPYNPPLRLLTSEKRTIAVPLPNAAVTLHRAKFYSPSLATLTWRLPLRTDRPTPVPRIIAGQHLILAMQPHLDTRVQMYQHMSSFAGGEKDLNDDGVRSWTISDAREVHVPPEGRYLEIDITIRRVGRGAVTPGLFNRAHQLVEYYDSLKGQLQGVAIHTDRALDISLPPPSWAIEADLLGIEGDLSLPSSLSLVGGVEHTPTLPKSLLYMVSGIGVTPLLAHLSALGHQADKNVAMATNVLIVLAARAGEVRPMLDLIAQSLRCKSAPPQRSSSKLNIELHVLHGTGEGAEDTFRGQPTMPPQVKVHLHPSSRLSADSLSLAETSHALNSFHISLPKALENAYICGGPAFDRAARGALSAAGWQGEIKSESFAF